jgi:hypothetical protein
MVDKTDDVDVLIEEDPKKPETDDATVVKVDGAQEAPVVEPEDGLETLKKQLADEKEAREREKSARIAAEARANAASEGVVQARTETHDRNIELVSNALEAVKQTTEILKGRYAEAAQNGDWAGMADIQAEMSDASTKKIQLENGLVALKNMPKPTVERQPITDPVESFASQIGNEYPRSQAWVRRHPEYVLNRELNAKMVSASQWAVANGYPADTDEYFREVEGMLGIANDNRRAVAATSDDATSDAARSIGNRSAPAAAPVSRGGDGMGTNRNSVRLTAAEIEMAEMSGMTPQEYAKQKMTLQKEGKIN